MAPTNLNKIQTDPLPELLRVAPDWYIAHNQYGHYHRKNPAVALPHYQAAAALNPNSFVGFYNQACAYARMGYYPEALAKLEEILGSEARMQSYRSRTMSITNDDAFDGLRANLTYGPQFRQLEIRLDAVPSSGDNFGKAYIEN